MGSSIIYLLSADMTEIANLKLIMKRIFFICINIGLFAVETLWHYLHDWDMRDAYTDSIIKYGFLKAQNESYKMTYAVKTVHHLFTWCGHERYTMMIENDFFFMKSIMIDTWYYYLVSSY